jgi:hypothetical protein
MSSKKGSRSSCWPSERLSEIESDSKESVLKTVLMQLEYPSGQGEETAVEFAILESKLPLFTGVRGRIILRSPYTALCIAPVPGGQKWALASISSIEVNTTSCGAG